MMVISNLNVLYEDNHIIVVVKPPNVPSQADSSKDKDMLSLTKAYLKDKYNKPGNVYLGLVHRLDRPVGGIMVFAKTSKAASRLSKQIANHEFKKKYLAVVCGILDKKNDVLVNNIVKKNDNCSIIVDNGGKEAILNYDVLYEDKKNNLSLLDIDLKTGRHHQIRVQFAYINHPLYGDQRYGNRSNKQIGLYAYKLEFVHPVKKELISFVNYPNYGIFKKMSNFVK